MQIFLQRFGSVVLGVLCGFDRLVFRGKLRQLYAPQGMNCYLGANHILRKDFKTHAVAVTNQVLAASLMSRAEQEGRYRYLHAGTDKDEVARAIAAKHAITEGLACVLRCVEPCRTFDLKKKDGQLTVQGEKGRCSQLYHYWLHPEFGWMHVRLQTWFPFTPEDLERWYLPWVRHAFLNFDSVEVLRYLGRSGHLYQTGTRSARRPTPRSSRY